LTAWRRLLRARALVGEEIERRLAEGGLPPLGWHEVLTALDEAPRRRLRHGALAERVMLSRGGLTRLVDRMAGAGLVERLPCEGDRRGANVSLTNEGAEALIRTRAVHSAVLERRFSGPLGIYAAGVSDALGAVIARAEADAASGGAR
jgi:DNA-binding MarR family transcriptional regulator